MLALLIINYRRDFYEGSIGKKSKAFERYFKNDKKKKKTEHINLDVRY